jgi:chromosome segregation ATPase
VRIAWFWAARVRLRRALWGAEAELGWLGWEQVDFFDLEINEEVKRVKEYENTQATLMNTSAELSGRRGILDQELAVEKTKHDEAQAALAEERAPMAAALAEAETKRRQKLAAIDRFDRALEEIARMEKQLEARSLEYMHIEKPSIAIRAEAREVSTELARLADERKIVVADKTSANQEAARLDPEIARLRTELQRIDAAAGAARERLAAATRRLTGEMRSLERQRKKSHVHMSHLDREKRKPYRRIGACMADHGLAPLNQPAVLAKVIALRERDAQLSQSLTMLRAACAAADAGMLTAFYLLLAAVLFIASLLACHLLRR